MGRLTAYAVLFKVALAAVYECDDGLRQQINQVSDTVVVLYTEAVQSAPAVKIGSAAMAI